MIKNMAQKFLKRNLLAPVEVSASGTSATFDLQGLRNAAFLILTAAFAFSGVNSLTFKIQESDNGTDWTDVPTDMYYDTDNLVYDQAGDANTAQIIQYRGNKRYARLAWTEAGTVAVIMGVCGISTDLEFMPKA